jgi:hypothetical protein
VGSGTGATHNNLKDNSKGNGKLDSADADANFNNTNCSLYMRWHVAA